MNDQAAYALGSLRLEAVRLRKDRRTVGAGVVLGHQLNGIQDTLEQADMAIERMPLTQIGNGRDAHEFGDDF